MNPNSLLMWIGGSMTRQLGLESSLVCSWLPAGLRLQR
jgi:hypothetical protein